MAAAAAAAHYLTPRSLFRDIPPAKDALFNEVYNEHCEYLRGVPGVLAIRRYRTVPYDFTVGGVKRRVDPVANTNEPVCALICRAPSSSGASTPVRLVSPYRVRA